MAGRVLLCGVSTRAAAASAARAGFEVTAIDAFADLDQHPDVRSLSVPRDVGRPFTAREAARASRALDCDAVAYLSNFENHPAAVRTLASGRTLWGNSPDVLRCVRNPKLVADVLGRRGLPAAEVRMHHADGPASFPRRESGGAWIVKPLASGGGHGIRPWTGADNLEADSLVSTVGVGFSRPLGCLKAAPTSSTQGNRQLVVPRRAYLQRFVDGVPGSVVFVAARGRAVPLGVSRQLIGDEAFGASGFRYCGSILAGAGDPQFADDAALRGAAGELTRAIAAEFDLVGLNGIDFVACDGVPWAIEVNPRWCASMELVEEAWGQSVFGLHARACGDGELPALDLANARPGLGAIGKAVVFARDDVTAGNTSAWLSNENVRDVPRAGERIDRGMPVCTVLATAETGAACYAALVRRAQAIYDELAGWARAGA